MNELELFQEKTVDTSSTMTTKELAEEINRVILKSRNHFDYVFSETFEQEKLEKLCSELKYYYLEKDRFFIKVQPYYSILVRIKENNHKNGFIYFIKDGANKLVKVGRANNIQRRFSALSGSNNNLKILKAIESNNTPIWERELHKYFKNKRQYEVH